MKVESNELLSKQLTIVVNSCDLYDDLWIPFFTLLKKYWNTAGIRILLNTESKSFQMDGLEIECVHSPKDYPYGKRMLNVLSKVKTPYVLPLLDDFFLRSPVNVDTIERIIDWMENDSQIVCFNCDCLQVYMDFEIDKYAKYRRIPMGNDYTLNMQAAVWRTESLKNYWRPNVSPWEWEVICNYLTMKHMKHKFYCLLNIKDTFMDYGHYKFGDIWGVYRGKWVKEDVIPLFQKEGIEVDYSKRGFYDPEDIMPVLPDPEGRWDQYGIVSRCLGTRYVVLLFLYEVYCGLLRRMNKYAKWVDYYDFLQEMARKRFIRLNSQK